MNEHQPVKDATLAQLVAVSLRLTMEVSVLHERLRTQHALLVKAGVLTNAAVEDFAADAAEMRERETFRRQLIEGIAGDLGVSTISPAVPQVRA